MCNLLLFILHSLHEGWQPRSPFAATQAGCLINAQGGSVWEGLLISNAESQPLSVQDPTAWCRCRGC